MPQAECSLAGAKFVWVTAGDEPVAHAAKAAGDIDEHLPLECPEEDLFAVVRRLVGAADARPSANTSGRFRGGLAAGALRRVCEYVNAHIAERIPTEDLARITGLSARHFHRAFKQTTGVAPHRYVVQRRIAAATELLINTARALAEIALELGFADQSHFTRSRRAGACVPLTEE